MINKKSIYIAKKEDLDDVVNIALELWPRHTKEEFDEEFKVLLNDKETLILLVKENSVIGFCDVSLRHDYVEGTENSPVAYLEGIYIKEEHRQKGYAKSLIEEVEKWAKSLNIFELASDCEYKNIISKNMHEHLGFKEVNVIRCFTKRIK